MKKEIEKTLTIICVATYITIAVSSTAKATTEYFIKRSTDQKTLYLQDSYTDPGSGNINVVLLDTGQLTGHAVSKLDDATMVYDKENSIYKMWTLASTGPYGYWSVYYAESDSLLNWNAKNIQECYYGVSDSWDISRQNSVSVLKESNISYKMWFSNYQASGWKTQIWYRSSTEGVTWTEPQLVVSAVSLDDWRQPAALHLTNGNYRLYYDYIYRDVYDFLYFYRADVEPDGITTSDVTQFAQLPCSGHVLGATIIGNQEGDSHHRIWLTSGGNLLRYESFDEGITWTITNMGTYDTTNYRIVGTFIPEPATLLLLGMGGLALLRNRRFR